MDQTNTDLILDIRRHLCDDVLCMIYKYYERRHVFPELMYMAVERRQYRTIDDFKVASDSDITKKLLVYLHNALSEYGLWNSVRDYVCDSKNIWSTESWVRKVSNHPKIDSDCREFSFAMHSMIKIARKGWHTYIRDLKTFSSHTSKDEE
jgi:hypothetical protein